MGNDQVLNIFTERGILARLNHPFIVSLQYAFQSRTKLFFVMDYCSGGDFFGFLKIKRKFTESETRFYAGEIALALDCLHRHAIVYRDLKPENMLRVYYILGPGSDRTQNQGERVHQSCRLVVF